MFIFKACEVKKAEFTFVNEHFFDERNAENGHYGQKLIIINCLETRQYIYKIILCLSCLLVK